MKRKFGFGLLIVVMLLFTQLSSALAENSYGDDWKVNQHKYSTWGDQFWQYAFTLPSGERDKFFASTGDCVQTNQNYEVFFLAGVYGGGGSTRNCTIKAGTRLFFPLINYAFGEFPKYYDPKAEPPYVPKTFNKWFDQVFSRATGTTAFASLDGENIVTSDNQKKFYVHTINPDKAPIYPWVGLTDPFGEPIIYQTVNAGYYLSLKLPARSQPYTLRFGGNMPKVTTFTVNFTPDSQWVKDGKRYQELHPSEANPFPNPYIIPLGGFSEDVTYNITVK